MSLEAAYEPVSPVPDCFISDTFVTTLEVMLKVEHRT